MLAAGYAERFLPDRYLRIRFEDLCREPREGAASLFAFVGLQHGNPKVCSRFVKVPESLGRWRRQRLGVLVRLHQEALNALQQFGYPVPVSFRFLLKLWSWRRFFCFAARS